MNSTTQYKNWQHTRYLKEMRCRARIKAGLAKKRRASIGHSRLSQKLNNTIRLSAPTHLSLVDNRGETLEYFNQALSSMERCKPRQQVLFDLKSVSLVTPDAIMYLIALVKNLKRCRAMHTLIKCNLPDAHDARAYIERTGFNSYVSTSKTLPQHIHNSAIQITSGREVEPALIGDICSFVSSKSALPARVHTKGLYQIITELMTNTFQHAYTDSNGIMDNRWYIYVEDLQEKIQFVFLDTGSGIPTTIKKNFLEKVVKFVGNNANDAKLISSALKGVYRSETGERHRGKGLPNIYDASKTDRISSLNIISGFGQCAVNESYIIDEMNSTTSFSGTLFCWQFDKIVEV